MYKVANGNPPEIMNEVSKPREETHYHVKHTTQPLVDLIHSVYNGSELVNFGPKIWNKHLLG